MHGEGSLLLPAAAAAAAAEDSPAALAAAAADEAPSAAAAAAAAALEPAWEHDSVCLFYSTRYVMPVCHPDTRHTLLVVVIGDVLQVHRQSHTWEG